MNVSTVILLAVITMTAATFMNQRDCRHVCKMDANGVVVTRGTPDKAVAPGDNS